MGERKFEETLEVLAKGEAYLEDEELPLGFLFIAGNALTSLKRYDEAEAVFIQATKQAPDLIDTHLALFSTLVTKGDTAGSKLLLLELFEQYGMIPRLLLKRATLNLLDEEWQKVLDDCQQVLAYEGLSEESSEYGTANALIQEAKIGMAKDLHANGKVFEAIELFQDCFGNPDTRIH